MIESEAVHLAARRRSLWSPWERVSWRCRRQSMSGSGENIDGNDYRSCIRLSQGQHGTTGT